MNQKLNPMVSVIVPVFNVADFLPQCITSIVSQSYKQLEIILVDDGSTDASGMLCDDFAATDQRVHVIHQSNGGLSEARNRGMKEALGEFVVFVDSDDFWMDTQGVEFLVNLMIADTSLDFIGFNCSYYYSQTNQYKKWSNYAEPPMKYLDADELLLDLVRSGTFPMSACLKLIRRSFLIEHQLFFKKGLHGEDIPWFINLLACRPTCCFVNLYMYAYRQGRVGSITQSFSNKSYDDLFGIIQHELDELPRRQWSEEAKNGLKSFLAYEVCILFTSLHYFPRNVRKKKRKQLLSYVYLLDYIENPKVRMVNFIRHLVGMYLTEKILVLYRKYR